MKIWRHLRTAIDEELVAFSAERFIGLLRIVVGLSSPWWKYLVCDTTSGVFDFVIPQSILFEILPIRFAGAHADFVGV